jgi:16S rRNA G966 N2-methylase RsmD
VNHCPKCGGPADNGFDRQDPPQPYHCRKCEASADLAAENEMLKQALLIACEKMRRTAWNWELPQIEAWELLCQRKSQKLS